MGTSTGIGGREEKSASAVVWVPGFFLINKHRNLCNCPLDTHPIPRPPPHTHNATHPKPYQPNPTKRTMGSNTMHTWCRYSNVRSSRITCLRLSGSRSDSRRRIRCSRAAALDIVSLERMTYCWWCVGLVGRVGKRAHQEAKGAFVHARDACSLALASMSHQTAQLSQTDAATTGRHSPHPPQRKPPPHKPTLMATSAYSSAPVSGCGTSRSLSRARSTVLNTPLPLHANTS